MKGAVAALVAASLLACVGFVMANPPLPEPLQYEQFCDNQKVSGTGAIDMSTSVVDKKIALEYHNVMAGDGDLELDQTHAYSDKAINQGPLFNESHNSSLNLLEKEKLTYNAKKSPLFGVKYLNSKAFYGGIGADVRETFSVNQMEKDQTTFFVSTAPKTPPKPCNPPTPYFPPTPCCPPNPRDSSIQNYPLTSCAHMPERLVWANLSAIDIRSTKRDTGGFIDSQFGQRQSKYATINERAVKGCRVGRQGMGQ